HLYVRGWRRKPNEMRTRIPSAQTRAVWLVIAFSVSVSPVAHAKATPRWAVHETLLARLPSSPLVDQSVQLSPDARRVAYRVSVGKKQALVVNGKTGTLHDSVGPASFSP